MANPNFSAPAISNKIASDIDSIRELAKLIAKLRGDLADNAPDGTIIFNQSAMNFQMKSGTVWNTLDGDTGKYAFNVDKLDGFHANAGIIANSIVVRDSKGVIPGNISGRAPNATQADELTTVNPIAKGGTGASTAAQARANLGTNDVGNLTAGVLPFARGGTGRTDGSANDVQTPGVVVDANVTTAKGRGQIGGLAMGRGIGTDANLFTENGRYWFTNADALVNFPKNNVGGSLVVHAYATYSHQDYINYNNTGRYWRLTQNSGSTWTPWYRVPEGLTDDYTTNSSVVAASAKALKNLKAYADTKLSLDGGSMTGRINGLRGTYNSSIIARYSTSALEIRENDGVGNTQTDIGYAPSIGFNWAQQAAAQLVLKVDGSFAFIKQGGERAFVDCHATHADTADNATHADTADNSLALAGRPWLESLYSDSAGWVIGSVDEKLRPVNTGSLKVYAANKLAGDSFAYGRALDGFTLPSGDSWFVFCILDNDISHGSVNAIPIIAAGGSHITWSFNGTGYTWIGIKI